MSAKTCTALLCTHNNTAMPWPRDPLPINSGALPFSPPAKIP